MARVRCPPPAALPTLDHVSALRRSRVGRGRNRIAGPALPCGLMWAWLLVLLATPLVACRPPPGRAAVTGPTLYLANGRESTIVPVDTAVGRASGPPMPGGPAPWQMAPGPDGSLLVLSIAPRDASQMTYISRTEAGWGARPVELEPMARPAYLAGEGRYSAVAYHLPDPIPGSPTPRCRLALVGLNAGEVEATQAACSVFESVFAVAVDTWPSGPVAYLGIWHWPHQGDDGQWVVGRGRIVAVDARSGAIVAPAPLNGAPLSMSLTSGPHRSGRRLYVVETNPGPGGDYDAPDHWRLRGLDPWTLDPLFDRTLGEPPHWLTVAPDGDQAYYFIADSNTLVHVELSSGARRRLSLLPGAGLGLAVTEDKLFIPNPEGHELWVVDRRAGQFRRPIDVGRHPIGLALRP